MALVCRRVFSTKSSNHSYILLFPGQGSQYIGMTRALVGLPQVQHLYTVASAVFGFDVLAVCLGGPQAVLDETVHCQPAIVVASLAAVEYLKLTSPEIISECKAAAGFSVGELAALIFAESLTLEEGFRIIAARSKAMQDACNKQPGAMLSVIGIEEHSLQRLCSEAERDGLGPVCVANYLFPNGFVVSGTTSAIDFIRSRVDASRGVMIKKVAVSGAFHSPLMKSAMVPLSEALAHVRVMAPRIPVYSNVTGAPHQDNPAEIRHNLLVQIVRPVLWSSTVFNMLRDWPQANVIEVGPGRQLKTMLKRINPDAFKSCKSFDV